MSTLEPSNVNENSMLMDMSMFTIEDNGILMQDCLQEQQVNIVNWFEKTEDEEIVLNNENLINYKPDPLLIQVSQRDSPTLLHLSDNEDGLGNICMATLQETENSYFDENSTGSKTDRNMNSLLKENESQRSKCDRLEELLKCKLTVEVCNINSKLQVRLKNKFGGDVFPIHFIQPRENGHTTLPIKKQQIKSIEKNALSAKLELPMPCLHSDMGLRLWLCPHGECRRAFYRYNVAKLHALKHLDHKPFKCDFPDCEWAFYTSNKLRRHCETHSKRKDFICLQPDCNRRFTTIYNLNWHRRHYHEKPATLLCLVKGCDKYFQTIRARELHLKTHGEAPYHCPVGECNKKFFLFTALSTHIRVHSHKESELRCPWPNCGRIFVQPCRLKQHTLQHTGQRPFICSYEKCKRGFSTASKLKRHLNSHTNERKFHCTIGLCSKSFLRSEHLKDHTLTHIMQRPFHCDECDASFTGKSGLCLHMKKKHQKPSEACARAIPFQQQISDKLNSEDSLEQAIQSLDVPSDIILGTGLLPEEPLELLKSESFSTVNLRDLD